MKELDHDLSLLLIIFCLHKHVKLPLRYIASEASPTEAPTPPVVAPVAAVPAPVAAEHDPKVAQPTPVKAMPSQEKAKASPVGATRKVIIKPAAKAAKVVAPKVASEPASSSALVPKEPSYPPPKRLRMQELTIREAESLAATPAENLVEEHTLVLTLKEGTGINDDHLNLLLGIEGFYHMIGRGNGKPIWKGEEAGTALAKFSPLNLAYIWYCDTWNRWIISPEAMEEDWNAQVVFAMMGPTMKEIYSPWDSYTPNDCIRIQTIYEWTMMKIQTLEDENCALKEQRVDSVMDEAVPEKEDKEDDKYIFLSSGEKLMRPPPPPGSKSA